MLITISLPIRLVNVGPSVDPVVARLVTGALAERSVAPVIPAPEDFPYTIRVISDILESNGSSSMASVCGATLGLMAAGVPLCNPVAGISIGLVKGDDDRWVLLTDIIGDEDHFGDMDFKIAGTPEGITGIQLDLKIDGISEEIMRATLKQARESRMEILRKMITTIPRPRSETSRFAPRLLRTKIGSDKIGLLIGPGGKNIRAIQEDTGANIDVEDDGTVVVSRSTVKLPRRPWHELKPARPRRKSAKFMMARSAVAEISVPLSRSCQAVTVWCTSVNCPVVTWPAWMTFAKWAMP